MLGILLGSTCTIVKTQAEFLTLWNIARGKTDETTHKQKVNASLQIEIISEKENGQEE